LGMWPNVKEQGGHARNNRPDDRGYSQDSHF